MKLVTLDYGCGTSSSILDYDGGKHAIVVTEDNWKHVLDANEDLMLVGHDFLLFMWDTQEKVEMWKAFPHRVAVWCFERIDAIVPFWMAKSHYSLSFIKQFADEIYACDEDDCNKYGYTWLPQWASRKFYDNRLQQPTNDKLLFSGQAGKPEYYARNVLLGNMLNDSEISSKLQITNTTRNLGWDDYVSNLLSYRAIINPIGTLKSLNTRAYECIYSGRMLFQQAAGNYHRHLNILEGCKNVVFFYDFEELKSRMPEKIEQVEIANSEKAFEKHSLYARIKSIGSELR
jgi:hypothetical protein